MNQEFIDVLQNIYITVLPYMTSIVSIIITVLLKTLMDKIGAKMNAKIDTTTSTIKELEKQVDNMRASVERQRAENEELKKEVKAAAYKLRRKNKED